MTNNVYVSDDEDDAEGADYYICARASMPAKFDDDLFDFCCRCDEKVRYRPHGPMTPKKLCIECATPDILKKIEDGTLEAVTTTKAMKEFQRIIDKDIKGD